MSDILELYNTLIEQRATSLGWKHELGPADEWAFTEIQRLRAAINTIRITTVRTVPTHIAEGPYPEAGLTQVLVGDWELIKSLQTKARTEGVVE